MNEKHRDVVFTSYFTAKPDPQRKVFVEPDRYEYLAAWYESLQRLGLQGIVFHDRLSPGFIERLSSGRVSFVAYELRTERSINDERFLCYRDFLSEHAELERVFSTDAHDIEFFRNPFELFDDGRFDLYCADDNGVCIGTPTHFYRGRGRSWMTSKMKRAYGEVCHADKIKLIAGIIGGTRENILRLLERMAEDFEALSRSGNMDNLDMAVFNKCAYDLFDERRILSGYPLNSAFKAYETDGEFYIRHK